MNSVLTARSVYRQATGGKDTDFYRKRIKKGALARERGVVLQLRGLSCAVRGRRVFARGKALYFRRMARISRRPERVRKVLMLALGRSRSISRLVMTG